MSVTARVRKLVPLLGTQYPGEVIATRDAIVRALRSVGLDLNDLANAISFSEPEPPIGQHAPPSFGDLARACRDLDRGRLTPREREFVMQMCRLGFSRQPSPRQLEWLASIFARLQRSAAA